LQLLIGKDSSYSAGPAATLLVLLLWLLCKKIK
jgi:hypothetical protein